MNKIGIYILLLLLLIPSCGLAKRTNLVISPSVIEAKGRAGDLLKFKINIKNNENFKATIYPIVEDFFSKKSKDAIDRGIDGSISPSKWIKIDRGAIRIEPGQNKDISLKLDIKNNAVAGVYSAKIYFPSAGNRYDAEKDVKNFNEPEIIVNINILDNIVKDAEISNFKSDKFLFFNNPIQLSFDFKNIGNRTISPTGDLSVYNNRNQELLSVPLDEKLKNVSANENRVISVNLPNIKGFGKYKAKIRLIYDNKTKNAQDVVYFTFLPWEKVLVLSVLLLIILSFISVKILNKQRIENNNLDTRGEKLKEHTVNLRKE